MAYNRNFAHPSSTTFLANPPQYASLIQTSSYPNQAQSQYHPPPHYEHMPAQKPEKRKQEILTCDACGIEVNSQQMMDVHLRGQKHIKKMKLKTVASTNSTSTSAPNLDNTDEEQPSSVPMSGVESGDSPTIPTTIDTKSNVTAKKTALQSLNELANHHKITAKYDLIKETGPAHCKQFEVRLTIADETYIGTGTSIKRAQQVAAEQALAITALKKPEAMPRAAQVARPIRGTYPNVRPTNQNRPRPTKPPTLNTSTPAWSSSLSREQRFQDLLERKSEQIGEDEYTIRSIHHFVENIERALKTVSDKLLETCQSNNVRAVPLLPEEAKLISSDQSDEDPVESFRMLKGSMKVSILAMRLFLKVDRQYSLVLNCGNKPNVILLNDICQELTIALSTQAIADIQLDADGQQTMPITYQVEQDIDNACLYVQCSLLPNHRICLMLTSPVFRSENYLHLTENLREQIEQLNPDPTDMLDKTKCLQAAAEIRHSHWFTHCMLKNTANLIVLRLLRDIQNNNQTPLSSLTIWSLILLVHKCQSQPIQSPTQLFRLVFTCLSSGILLGNGIGPGIIDPCEKDLVDAVAYLTAEQRLALTNYGQWIVRLIAFEQYDQIFFDQPIQQ